MLSFRPGKSRDFEPLRLSSCPVAQGLTNSPSFIELALLFSLICFLDFVLVVTHLPLNWP